MAAGPVDCVGMRGGLTSLIRIGGFALVWFVRVCIGGGGGILFSGQRYKRVKLKVCYCIMH